MVLICGKPYNYRYHLPDYQQLPCLSTLFVERSAFRINLLQGYTHVKAKIWINASLAISFSPRLLADVYKTGVTNIVQPKIALCG